MLSSFSDSGSIVRPLLWSLCVLALGCNTDANPTPVTPGTSQYEVAEEDSPPSAAVTNNSGGSDKQAPASANQSAGGVQRGQGLAQTPQVPSQAIQQSPGQPRVGQPGAGQPGAGQPGVGQPGVGQPGRPSSPSASAVSGRSTPPAASSSPSGGGSRAEQLLLHINQLASRQPAVESAREAEAELIKTQEEIVRTADELLGLEAQESLKIAAAEAKLTALAGLQQIHVPDALSRRNAFCEALKQHEIPQLAELGRRASFAFALNEFFQGDHDTKTILAHFKQLVAAENKDAKLVEFTSQIATAFEQNGYVDEAAELLELVVAEFKGTQDAALRTEVAGLSEQAVLIKTDLRRKFDAMVQRQPGALEEFLSAAKMLLAGGHVGPSTLRVLLEQAGPVLESLQRDSGEELYTLIEQTFRDDPDPKIVALVKSSLENFQRRSELMNQPYTVYGRTLDGERFDWSQYRGKVVLVDFWATWCDLCVQEMSNIQRNYLLYRDQGFEVVGVNLDSDMQNVERFFSVQRLPWPTVVSAIASQRGMNTPLAVESGVNYIPFVILVGRDGKVAALNVSGPDLGPKIAELLRTTAAP